MRVGRHIGQAVRIWDVSKGSVGPGSSTEFGESRWITQPFGSSSQTLNSSHNFFTSNVSAKMKIRLRIIPLANTKIFGRKQNENKDVFHGYLF